MKKASQTRRVTSRAEAFKIYELLQRNGSIQDGFYIYNEGMSDSAIAKMVSSQMSVFPVRNIRSEHFGNLKNDIKESIMSKNKKLEELELLFLKLSERVDVLEARSPF